MCSSILQYVKGSLVQQRECSETGIASQFVSILTSAPTKAKENPDQTLDIDWAGEGHGGTCYAWSMAADKVHSSWDIATTIPEFRFISVRSTYTCSTESE